MTSDFNWHLNRQGPRGQQGPQGEQGFSPVITVAEDTLSAYILRIQTQTDTFLTSNLRGSVEDLGGTYVRYDRATGKMYAGSADIASPTEHGIIKIANEQDVTDLSSDTAATPSIVNNMILNNDTIVSMKEDIDSVKGNYVTTDTTQTITGRKKFNNNTVTLGADGSQGYAELFSGPVFDYQQGYWSSITGPMMWVRPSGQSGDTFRCSRLFLGAAHVTNKRAMLNDITFVTEKLILSNPADSTKYDILSAKDIATVDKAGIVKPDGSTVFIDENGVISAKSSEIDDAITSTQSTWSSSKISGELTTIAQEVVDIQGDVASLDADVSTLKPVVESHTTSIGAINDSISMAMADITELKEGKQDKLTAGENITIEGNVISAVGGDTSNLVTLDTEQTITGLKTFSAGIKADGYKPNIGLSDLAWTDASTNPQIGNTNRTLTIHTNAVDSGKILIDTGGGLYEALHTGNVSRFIDGTTITFTNNKLSAIASGGASIDDTNPSTETVYSSSKVEELIQALTDRISALENEINGGSANGPSTVAVRGATTSIEQATYITSEAGQAESSAEEQQQQ